MYTVTLLIDKVTIKTITCIGILYYHLSRLALRILIGNAYHLGILAIDRFYVIINNLYIYIYTYNIIKFERIMCVEYKY